MRFGYLNEGEGGWKCEWGDRDGEGEGGCGGCRAGEWRVGGCKGGERRVRVSDSFLWTWGQGTG